MRCYARNLDSLASRHRRCMYDDPGVAHAVVLISPSEAPRTKFCPLQGAVLLSTSTAVLRLVHIDLPRVDARHFASFPPLSLRAHLIYIACVLMNRDESTMSDDDDDNWTTESEGETTASEDSEADRVNEHRRKRGREICTYIPISSRIALFSGNNDMNRAGNSRLGRLKIKILERQIILRDPQILRDIVMVADIGISRNWVLYAHI
jgi:hypothetical protein